MYTMKQVLSELGISQSTLYYWLNTKKLTVSKQYDNNRERIFTEEDFRKFRELRERRQTNLF
ncbi:MAG: MerR family transcriptional regulator [Candidatus Wukongarchaeota archaeon]